MVFRFLAYSLVLFPRMVMAFDYWSANNSGWYWYELLEQLEPEIVPPQPQLNINQQPTESPEITAHKKLQKQLEDLRIVAIMNPTFENVKAYLRTQQEVMDRAALFADVWQRVIWTNPEFDYSLQGRPVNTAAIYSYDNQRKLEDEQFLARIADDHGIFFFFGRDCIYCEQVGKALKDLSNNYGILVRAIAIDNAFLAGYEQAWQDNGFANSLGVKNVPAVYLGKFDGTEPELYPVSFGPITKSELVRRIAVLNNSKPGSRF